MDTGFALDIKLISYMLVLLNPFAIFLYLRAVMAQLTLAQYFRVLVKASAISFFIYLLFGVTGETLFTQVFKINFNAFRIFGGLVIFYNAFVFIVKGKDSMIQLRGSMDRLANEISMPYMVGAGSISVAILMGTNGNVAITATEILLALAANLAIIMLLWYGRHLIGKTPAKEMFDNYMEVLVRIMGFMVGGVGIDMVINGIFNIIAKGGSAAAGILPLVG